MDSTPLLNTQGLTTIVEILFGDKMRSYENEFKQVHQIIRENQERNHARLNATADDLLATIQNVEQRIMAQLQKNHEELLSEIARLDNQKTDRAFLGKMLVELGTQLSA